LEKVQSAYALKEETETPEDLNALERFVILHAIDQHWQDHLTEMDELRNSVGLRGYGQRDPLSEYKNEAFACFESMLAETRNDACRKIFRLSSNRDAFDKMVTKIANDLTLNGFATGVEREPGPAPKISINIQPTSNVGRNDPCPCGSGKKYKKCCGRG
jgi:preprotein translocase subunit SecA